MRMSARIVEAVRAAMENLQGTERVATAIAVALTHIRAEPLGPLIMGSIQPNHDGEWLTDSPGVADLAEEVIGQVDPLAAQWLIRVTLALWYWPLKDRVAEFEMIRRFVGPSSFLESA